MSETHQDTPAPTRGEREAVKLVTVSFDGRTYVRLLDGEWEQTKGDRDVIAPGEMLDEIATAQAERDAAVRERDENARQIGRWRQAANEVLVALAGAGFATPEGTYRNDPPLLACDVGYALRYLGKKAATGEAERDAARAALAALYRAGRRLSNTTYNIAQQARCAEADRANLDAQTKQWDDATDAHHDTIKAARAALTPPTPEVR